MESQDKTKEQLIEELQALESKFHEMRKAAGESEEKFRLLYENAPLAYQSLDENGFIIEINQAWSDLLGYSREEVIGKWCGEFLTAPCREKFTTYFPQFKAAGAIHGIEFEMVKKDGSRITVAVYGRIGSDEQGKFKQTHCILHDITEQKCAEEARARSEKIYRQMFEGSRAVKLLIDPESGELIDANPAAEHFYGYAIDDLKRMKISDINILPPEQIFSDMAKAKTARRQHFFFKHRLASGEIRDVEVHSSPLDLGDMRLLYSIIHDITERKKAEDAIRRAKRDWESTFDSVSDMVMVVDSQQRLRRVNVALAEQLGATPRDLVGKLCYEVIHGLNYPPDYCPHASLMKEREHHAMEYDEDRLGGTMQVHCSSLFDSEGQSWGVVHVFRNVTERKQFERRLQKQNVFLNNVLESLTHPFYVIDPDTYEVTMANSASGMDLREGATCYALTHNRTEPCNGADHPCPVHQVKTSGQPLTVEHVHYDKDNLPRNMEIHCSPLFGENGTIDQIIEYCIDITDRKRIETHLRDSEERFRTLFETAPDCIFMKDRSLRYSLVNPAMAHLFGLPPSDFIGKSDEDLYGQWIGSHLRERDSRVLGGESVEVEHTRSIAGTPITFHDITIPIHNSAGEIVGVCGLSVNITDRKQRVTPFRAPVTLDNRSEAMRATMVMATVAAEKEGMILLEGESGVGKDYLARYIHAHSPRRDGPYFALNCAALPPELVESELFGYEPGAFTGAARRKRGLVELAEGGTLLLNEIGELSPIIQSKLLSFLDSRSFTRVGGEKIVKVDARLIAATNRDLLLDVKTGRFRQDLYYRINVLGLRVPPLRERREDIPILVHQIMARLKQEMQLPKAPMINPQSMNALTNYSWPGNVRELRNVLERALMLWTGGPLELSLIGREEAKNWYHTVHFPEKNSLNDVTQDLTRALVAEALRRSDGNKVKAAGFLGISRYTLFRLLKTFDQNVRS
jgi:PAS domain S-box-containing protein